MPVADRFWLKVDKKGPKQPHMRTRCWTWLSASSATNTYGTFAFPAGERWKHVKAHRYSWQLTNGEIPAGMQVLHRCDNKRCVRPEHLFIGTQLDNMIDMVQKGRHRPRGFIPHALRAA